MEITMKQNLQQWNYQELNPETTQNWLRSNIALMDRVFNSDGAFQQFVDEDTDGWIENNPYELFKYFKQSLADQYEQMTKYQRNFYDLFFNNVDTPTKWYQKNGSKVNLSPKQVEWFKKWYEKNSIGHAFLLGNKEGAKIKPNLFDRLHTHFVVEKKTNEEWIANIKGVNSNE